jgi:hypothetical protein
MTCLDHARIMHLFRRSLGAAQPELLPHEPEHVLGIAAVQDGEGLVQASCAA